jgi:hypothetical protein
VTMLVEMRLRGTGSRLLPSLYEGCELTPEGDQTLIRAEVGDEAAAFSLIERAREVGLVVLAWRYVGAGPPGP